MHNTDLNYVELGKQLKLYRIQHGISQQQIADMLGYSSRSTVARIEKGEIDLPVSKASMIASLIGTASDIKPEEDDSAEIPDIINFKCLSKEQLAKFIQDAVSELLTR